MDGVKTSFVFVKAFQSHLVSKYCQELIEGFAGENTFNETVDEQPMTVEALNLPPIPHDYGSGKY